MYKAIINYPGKENLKFDIDEDVDIYEAIELAKEFYKNLEEKTRGENICIDRKNIFEDIGKVNNIINLHDEDGMYIKRINNMKNSILNGNHILDKDFPNINFIEYNKEIVIFDGHHTLISYLLAGYKLEDIPFVLLDKEKIGERDLLPFFGEYGRDIEISQWKELVIDWKSKSIVKRKRKNFSELYNYFKEKISE